MQKMLPLCTQEIYQHKNVGCTTEVYLWKSHVILIYEILVYLRSTSQIRIMLPIYRSTKPYYNFYSSKCINEILLFIVMSYLQTTEMIYTRVQTQTLYRESTYTKCIQTNAMYLPYVDGKSSVVLLPVHNFSNLLSVMFIEYNFILYMHKHRIL